MAYRISTQSLRTKSVIQCVLDTQAGRSSDYISDVLSLRGARIEDFEAFQVLIAKDHLRRIDMYDLLFPYNKTEHGKIMHSHIVGLKGKKNVKASVRACISHLVKRKKVMEEDPVLVYGGGEFACVY